MRNPVIFLILFQISFCCNAQNAEDSLRQKSTIIYDQLSLSLDQQEIILNNVKDFPEETQLSIAIIADSKVVYAGFEVKNDSVIFIDNHKSVFEIGSITKVFTSTILAEMVVDGFVDLDDAINSYLPYRLKEDQKITFKQLANHTSGLPRLPRNLDLAFVDQSNPYKNYDESKLKDYLQHELTFGAKPGETYQYSNLGAGLLGYVLTKITNKDFETLLQELVFDKYNMTVTTTDRSKVLNKLVKGRNKRGSETSNWDLNILAGAGAILSNVEDLSKFIRAQFDTTNKAMALTQQATFRANLNMRLGLGWHIVTTRSGQRVLWHNGGTGGYTSSIALDAKRKMGIVILSNVSAFHDAQGNIDKIAFSLLEKLNAR